MTNDQIVETFRLIATGEKPRGSFLTRFAEAVVQADHENVEILRPAAEALIAKYKLTS
ncbi:MAG: hypothetical protein WC325_11430 [Candidatus Bathyarchaeia archaeon]|jgi:hypothetical protein